MQKHACKEEAITDLKRGMTRGEVAKKYGVPVATVFDWYDYEKEMHPEDFKGLPDKRFPRDKINQTEARITTLISPFVNKEIPDKDWEKLQVDINKELARMVE